MLIEVDSLNSWMRDCCFLTCRAAHMGRYRGAAANVTPMVAGDKICV